MVYMYNNKNNKNYSTYNLINRTVNYFNNY